MKLLAILIICLLIIWIMMAAQCSRFAGGDQYGVLWNKANASPTIDGINWRYDVTSIKRIIYNQTNPCFENCNTFQGETYAPDSTVLRYAPETDPVNMVPFCSNCHGLGTVAAFNNTTSVVHANGAPMMYGD